MDHPYGWLSLAPPVAAIILAILTRRVVLSLIVGIFAGAFLTKFDGFSAAPWPSTAAAISDTLEVHLWKTLVDEGKLRVFAFTLLMGAMIGVINRSGGMRGLINVVSRMATTRRSGQLTTWVLGLLIFFDDYANTMLLGNTLRPLCDRLKISREKLAYLVDSTAAPVAGLALVSTWIAVELDYIRDGLNNLDVDTGWNAFTLFVSSIKYRFYVLSALMFVPLTAWMRRDFGPMLRAERMVVRGEASPGLVDDDAGEMQASDDVAARWFNAVIPILVTLGIVLWLIIRTGKDAFAADNPDTIPDLRDIFGWADSSFALQYGALAGLLVAAFLSSIQRLLSGKEIMAAAGKGARLVLPAIMILWCASTLSKMTGNKSVDGAKTTQAYEFKDHRLYTADFLQAKLLGEDGESSAFSASMLPTVVFLLASVVAFCTGTSFGTMGILVPMVVTLAHAMISAGGTTVTATDPIFLSSIGGVLAGAVFGDHCSPISDTTVLSSQSSGCDHIAHVWTQMPYAVAVACVSVLLGTLPLGFG
ncbi:MAG: Na+/H+ antiporter NhaC family protein, partial [Planctomycetota bacterium]